MLRRIRHKRKGNNLVADPVKLGVRIKHAKLPINSCVVARSSQLNHHAQASPRLSATRKFSKDLFLGLSVVDESQVCATLSSFVPSFYGMFYLEKQIVEKDDYKVGVILGSRE
ncbi:hypothetical protein RJT34_19449 [Clitoria ternatea]|uniref:Uncharacterized protein n=1 Tax=Clitoria ternatea TaxID=43366 RepID=A0AAN9IRG4_CLITE